MFKLEYTLRGRWRPACFLSLLGRMYRSGSGGGVPVSFKMFKNPIGFSNQDSIPALTTHKCFKNIKVTDGRTSHISTRFWTTSAPLQLQFPEFSGSGVKPPPVSALNPFRNRSRWQFTVCYSICTFRKVPHNQHPAGPVRSPVLVFASSKKYAGRNNLERMAL